jgi:hypothetical protein
METVQFQSSGLLGAKGMMQDIFSYLKFALFTKIGLIMTLLCIFLAMLVLLITGCFSTIGIIFTVLVFIAFIVLSFFTWFKNNKKLE